MRQLKKVTMAFAMVMAIGAATVPATQVGAATKSCTQSSTQNSCDFTKGKLCYTITGKNSCTVSGLSKKGQNSTTCKIPASVTCNGKTYNVTKVAANAFKNCDNLNTVKLNNCITSIGKNAFSGCDNLSNVTLGSNVNTVGSNAFNNCTNLNNILCSGNIASTGNNCFGNAILNMNSCR